MTFSEITRDLAALLAMAAFVVSSTFLWALVTGAI